MLAGLCGWPSLRSRRKGRSPPGRNLEGMRARVPSSTPGGAGAGRHRVRALARAPGVTEVVGVGELLGDDQAPGVDDKLPGLGRVQGREVAMDPVEAHVRRRGHLKLVRL